MVTTPQGPLPAGQNQLASIASNIFDRTGAEMANTLFDWPYACVSPPDRGGL